MDVEEPIVFVIEEMNICAAAFIDGMERLEEVPGGFLEGRGGEGLFSLQVR